MIPAEFLNIDPEKKLEERIAELHGTISKLRAELNHEVYVQDKVRAERDRAEAKLKLAEEELAIPEGEPRLDLDLLEGRIDRVLHERDGNVMPLLSRELAEILFIVRRYRTALAGLRKA